MADQKFTTGEVSGDIMEIIGRLSTIRELAETIASDTGDERVIAQLAWAICDVARVGELVGEEIACYSKRDECVDITSACTEGGQGAIA